jgi:hypothetical protein
MIKRIAAISVLAGAVLVGGGGLAFADPPPTDPGNGNGATVTTIPHCGPGSMGTGPGTGHRVTTPSGNINTECHVHP